MYVVEKPELNWREWTPWLYGEDAPLTILLNAIPSSPVIPYTVRLFENPRSPIHLPGPTDMLTHDAIHCLLGRGLFNQDEAFVIGFCMGASSSSTKIHCSIFELVGTIIYPKPYRFKKVDMLSLRLAFEFAKSLGSSVNDIHLFDFRSIEREPIKKCREAFGIDLERLRNVFYQEKSLRPKSLASKRLPENA